MPMKAERTDYRQFKRCTCPSAQGLCSPQVPGHYPVPPSTSLGEGCGNEHFPPPENQFPRLTDLRGYSDSSSSPELERGRKTG